MLLGYADKKEVGHETAKICSKVEKAINIWSRDPDVDASLLNNTMKMMAFLLNFSPPLPHLLGWVAPFGICRSEGQIIGLISQKIASISLPVPLPKKRKKIEGFHLKIQLKSLFWTLTLTDFSQSVSDQPPGDPRSWCQLQPSLANCRDAAQEYSIIQHEVAISFEIFLLYYHILLICWSVCRSLIAISNYTRWLSLFGLVHSSLSSIYAASAHEKCNFEGSGKKK